MNLEGSDQREELGPPESSTTEVGDWVGALPKEGRRTHRERIRQGEWRAAHLGWPAGAPQQDRRVRARYPTLPNWLAECHDGVAIEDAGHNLMSPEARAYARERLSALTAIDGKAEPDRLWRNLLSSQPMAFSIAGHLHRHQSAAAEVLALLTDLPVRRLAHLEADEAGDGYALDGIEAEWFPPRDDHTQDMSGCDIACCLELESGERVLLTVEVKYTDTFSSAPANWDRYKSHLIALGLDESATDALVSAGCSQVLRQVMITESVRSRGLVEGCGPDGRVDRTIAVVLAHEDDSKAASVVETLNDAVGATVPVHFWSHRRFLAATGECQELVDWSGDMATRYLGA